MSLFDYLFKPKKLFNKILDWLDVLPEENNETGMVLNYENNILPLPLYYGKGRVEGLERRWVFRNTKDWEESDIPNETLYMVIPICHGPIKSIGQVYLDGIPIEDARYAKNQRPEEGYYAHARKFLGGEGQLAYQWLMDIFPEWTAQHRGRNVAWLFIHLQWVEGVFTGIPKISCDIEGKLITDIRTGAVDAFDNAALVAYDYATNPIYGWRQSASTLLLQDFKDGADVCDTLVTKDTSSAEQVPLFTFNGMVETNKQRFENFRTILAYMRAIPRDVDGKLGFFVEKDDDPVMDITLDDITGTIDYEMPGKSGRFNRVIVTYLNPDKDYMQDQAIWPPTGDPQHDTYLAEDGGELLEKTVSMTNLNSYAHALYWAELVCRRSRAQVKCSVPVMPRCYPLEPGDVVRLTTRKFALKPMRVIDTIIEYYPFKVSLVLTEHQSSIYPWSPKAALPDVPAITIPKPWDIAMPTGLAYQTVNDSTTAQGKVSFTHDDKAVRHEMWIFQANTFVKRLFNEFSPIEIGALPAGEYEARVKSYRRNDYDSPMSNSVAFTIPTPEPVSGAEVLPLAEGLVIRPTVASGADHYQYYLEYSVNDETFATPTQLGPAREFRIEGVSVADMVHFRITSEGLNGVNGLPFVASAQPSTDKIPVMWVRRDENGVIVEIMFAVLSPGEDWELGTDASVLLASVKQLLLSASNQMFKVAADDSHSPASITFTATANNLAGEPVFSVTSGTATLTGTGNTRTLAAADMTTELVTITVTQDGLSDSMTIVKLYDGAEGESALVGYLTNESHNVPALSDGSSPDLSGAGGSFKVFYGTLDVTGDCTFAVVAEAGCDVSIDAAGNYSTVSMPLDSAQATFEATYEGSEVLKTFTLAKSRRGQDGDQGPQGVPGEPGADGQATYTWIRYADDAAGTGISNDPLGKAYIGFAYNKTTQTESADPADYTWSLVQGPQGNQGVPGESGTDGTTYYTWIKYSANPDGTGLTDLPQADTKYIGIAVNQTVQAESGDKADYVWSRWRGEDGQDGEPGQDGTPGQRGSLHLYVQTTGSAWNSTEATAAFGAYGGVQNADQCTLHNTSVGFSQMRTYSDSNGWVQVTQVIDGNLLVNGSVVADKININDLYSRNATISGSLTVGATDNGVTITGGAGNSYIDAKDNGNSVFRIGKTANTSFIAGSYLGAGTVRWAAFSQEVIEKIGQSVGGTTPALGGVRSRSIILAVGTHALGSFESNGQNVTLNASWGGWQHTRTSSAYSTPSVTLQWLRDGVAIAGASRVTTGSAWSVNEGGQTWYYQDMPAIDFEFTDTAAKASGTSVYSLQVTLSQFVPTGELAFRSDQPVSGSATASVDWADVTGKPTTISGFGITDGVTTGTTQTVTGRKQFRKDGQSINSSTGAQGAAEIYAANGADAFMAFHIGGDYAAYLGLDNDTNQFCVGGWSMGAVKYALHHEGNQPISVSMVGDTVPKRNSSGDIWARLFRSEYTSTTPTVGYIMVQHAVGAGGADNYIRPTTPAQFRAAVTDSYYRGSTWMPTKADIGLGNVGNYGISDSAILNSSTTYASSAAVYSVNSALGGKANATHTHDVSAIVSGTLPITRGGTGRTDGKAVALASAVTINGVNFDGSQNITITATPNSHGHAWSELSGIPVYATRWPTAAEAGARADTWMPTAAQVGAIPTAVNQWHTSSDGWARLYWGSGSHTYIRTASQVQFRNAGNSTTFVIDASGNVAATGQVTGTDCVATSDRRVKAGFAPILDAMNKLHRLNGQTFTRLDMAGKRHAGLIAQDVQAVLPEAISEHDGKLNVSAMSVLGLVVEAIKELDRKVEGRR